MDQDEKLIRLSSLGAVFGKQSTIEAWRKRNVVCRPFVRVEFDSHNVDANWFLALTKKDDHD